jgi:type II secretory pathway component GspD/PulD (secretin)
VVNTNTNNTAETEMPFGGIEFPELARSLIETEVVVQSGETVVMGGLMRQREQDDSRGIPIISSLPFIGKLFTRTSVNREQENLLVFVTATLISKRGEDMLPLQRNTPDEAETRGRFIEDNAPADESIPD